MQDTLPVIQPAADCQPIVARQPNVVGQPDVARLKSLLESRPLYLIIETTNICNARCCFCAYPKMTRPKSVMSDELFKKVIRDYQDMGGGAVSLTPIVGDALVDPQFVDRIETLRNAPTISHTSFTTNGIAWLRYQPHQRVFILENTDVVSISIGGVDRRSYKTMFGVDRFDSVASAIDDMCRIKRDLNLPVEIHLLFRANRPIDELLTQPGMNRFKREEINERTGINNFGNWGGVISANDLPRGAHLITENTTPEHVRHTKRNPCFVFHLAPEITTTGLVSACGCMNAEANELILGDISTNHLRDIWTGDAIRKLKSAFGTDDLPDICKRCTYYEDGEKFIANPALRSFRVGNNPWQVMRKNAPPAPSVLLTRSLGRLKRQHRSRVALYGAGSFTRRALADLTANDLPILPIAIIDDNPALVGTAVASIPVIRQSDASKLDLDAVVISSDRFTENIWESTRPLRNAGVHVTDIATDRDAEIDASSDIDADSAQRHESDSQV
jgi:MoaA/NifB/PqqE/SkfB family radical SAM enzyme